MKKIILAYLRQGWDRLKRIQDDPRKTARGFALGVFIGMTPFVGLQVLIALFLASILKWNRTAASLGVFNTNVLTGPFLFGLSYFVGAWALQLELDFDAQSLRSFSGIAALFTGSVRVLYALLLGGLITGLPSSCRLLAFPVLNGDFMADIYLILP